MHKSLAHGVLSLQANLGSSEASKMAGEPVKLISIWLLHAAIPTSAKPYTENMPDLVSPGGLRVDLAAREASFIVCLWTGDALIP